MGSKQTIHIFKKKGQSRRKGSSAELLIDAWASGMSETQRSPKNMAGFPHTTLAEDKLCIWTRKAE